MRLVELLAAVAVVSAAFGLLTLDGYYEARTWQLEAKKPAPIYETDIYPYASGSPPNRIVGYLNPGVSPEIIGMGKGKEWWYWEVRLPSGERGFIFAPDVDAKHKGTT